MKDTSDALSAHYLGGRSFGPLMTAGTMFASLFSGYTVVGVPNEAFNTGWAALRWFPSGIGVVAGYAGTGFRLRKCSLMRNHQSPVDFITDRFRSQVLRYTIVLLQFAPSLIYLSAQVISIKGTFNSIFELDPDSPIGVLVIFVLILIFEWTGGLVSVASTDAIQGIVMSISFLALPIVIYRNFGGWSDIDPATYPEPTFYQNPTAKSQWLMWNFGMVNVGFFSLPHLLQRTYAARDLRSLKAGYSCLAVGSWFTWMPGIFLGTVGVQMLADAGVENPSSPFAAILEQVMNVGGFAEAVGVIAFTASLAAIMSTADSIIIAIR
jgi:sodium/proline symporter